MMKMSMAKKSRGFIVKNINAYDKRAYATTVLAPLLLDATD